MKYASNENEEVLYSIQDGVATIHLNRPKALNALNINMVQSLSNMLQSVCSQGNLDRKVDPLSCLIIKGIGGKAFCAGGDIKQVVEEIAGGDNTESMRFFSIEYRLNRQIARCPLPYVALLDGITMGGGAGVSVHGHFRIATEKTLFAMPECAIGLFPDVGASSFLQRLPGRLGLWLGLTGARLKGVDVRTSGLATHYIPSSMLSDVECKLHQLNKKHASTPGSNQTIDFLEVHELLCQIESSVGPMPEGLLSMQLPWINAHFSASSVKAIVNSLKDRQMVLKQSQKQQETMDEEGSWLQDTLQGMAKGSPLSMSITFELFRRTRHKTLEECLELDLKIARKFCTDQSDFVEGVRATLVDRRQPVWKFASLEEVPEHIVLSFFETGNETLSPNSKI